MTRTMLFALAATTTVAGGLSAFFGQGSSVSLQPTTPGTQQVGNANVSGRIIAGSVHVTDPSPTGQAIVGSATSTTGANFGGFFRSDSPLGRALYGRASALSGTTHGVWGQADSPGGRGVTGVAPATSGNATGVWGQTASTTGRGVYGYTTSIGGVNYGVFGQSSSPQGFGVFSQGNLHATGVLSGNGSGLTNVNAAQLGGLLPGAFLQAIPNPLIVNGTTNGVATILGSTTGTSTGSTGVRGSASALAGSTRGVHGSSASTSGRGVFGEATALTGTTYGGRFESDSTAGRGVYAQAGASSGATFGGSFLSFSTAGTGVSGRVSSSTGNTKGVYGESASDSGYGVHGLATSQSGYAYGGYFETESDQGAGVRGVGSDSIGVIGSGVIGVSGEAHIEDARGVVGFAYFGTGKAFGVFGGSNSGGAYGVFGQLGTQSGSGYAVYANGALGASGTKSFRIDHPLDPENKYLLHYAAESPMPQNFYVGNVVTDAKGYAWVDLPDYFSEINTNFKYQLTVISSGVDFVQAMVSKKIQANRFQIRTSAPNVEVSWEVKADRNDLYVRNRQPKDVVPKEGRERGTYQHPEFYGFGPERGLAYDGERQKPQTPPAMRNR